MRQAKQTVMAGLALLMLTTGALAQRVQWNEMPLPDNTWAGSDNAFRQGSYAIEVAAGSALEYKLGIEAGQPIVYHWTVDMQDPSLLEVEFHGHTEPVDGKGDLMFYTIHQEGEEQGSLRAPFTGTHGWYLNNTSDEDIVVHLQVAGFYSELE